MKYLCGKTGRNSLIRLLSLFTAAIVAVSLAGGMLTVSAKAEAADVTVDQLVTALRALDSELEAAEKLRNEEQVKPVQEEETEPEEAPEATDEAEETEPAEEPSEPEETALRDDLADGRLFVADALKKVQGEQGGIYLKQEILEDIQACIRAVNARTNLKEKAAGAVEVLTVNADLEEAVRQNLTAAVGQTVTALKELPYEPVYLLEKEFTFLETGVEEGELTAPNAVQDSCNAILDLDQFVLNCVALADAMPAWNESGKKIDEISRGLTGKDVAPVAEDGTISELSAIVERRAAAEASIANFHTLEPAAQKELLDSMRQLEAEVEIFLYAAAAENAVEDARQQEQLDNTAAEVKRTSKLLVVGYIALGVSVLAVIMGIVAEVCAVRKSRQQPVDFNVVASREDAEALQKQNRSMRSHQDLQEKKLDNIHTEIGQMHHDLRQRIDELDKRVSDLEKGPIFTAPPLPPCDPPLPPEPPKKGMLDLDFQKIFPANSRLYLRENGSYILYADDTLGIGEKTLGFVNSLNSWKGSGLLYLFNPVIDGQELDSDRAALPAGYFKITGIARRAKVARGFSDDYTLLEKGSLIVTRS